MKLIQAMFISVLAILLELTAIGCVIYLLFALISFIFWDHSLMRYPTLIYEWFFNGGSLGFRVVLILNYIAWVLGIYDLFKWKT